MKNQSTALCEVPKNNKFKTIIFKIGKRNLVVAASVLLIGAAVLLAAGIALGMGKRVRAARLIPAYLFPVIYGVALLLVRRMMESD